MTPSRKQGSHKNKRPKAVFRFWNKAVFLNRLRTTRLGAVAIKLALKRPKAAFRFLRVVFSNRHRMRQMGVVAISLALYILLVVAYFFVVLRRLNEPLARLFQENLNRYALASVLLILGQGILLSLVTSGLLRLGSWVNNRRRS